MYKLFEITMDNNPGGWKSGEDPKWLVVSESREESIEIFKNSYGTHWSYTDGVKTFGNSDSYNNPTIRDGSNIYSVEIKFDEFDIEFTNRETKIDKLLDNDNN